MRNKKQKQIIHKIKLSQADQKLLNRYCIVNNLGQTIAIKRILKHYLLNNISEEVPTPENQLGLFDPIQMNIFDK
jgi:hypothetical protein